MTAHVVGGLVALLAAVIALATEKGGALHRGSGHAFVVAMVVMAATGAALAAFVPERLSVVAGALTLYLVITALLTVRPPPTEDRVIHWVALGFGAFIALLSFSFGVEALTRGGGELDGFPAPLYFMFGAVAAMAAIGDLVALRSPPPAPRRLARHLWRMCFALFITTASLFLGQAQVFPAPVRHFALLAIPVIAVLLVMTYWLVRVLWFQPCALRPTDAGVSAVDGVDP